MTKGSESPSAHEHEERRFLSFGSRGMIVARIDGIDDHDTIEDWIRYERNNHGRKWVFKHLNERSKEIGTG